MVKFCKDGCRQRNGNFSTSACHIGTMNVCVCVYNTHVYMYMYVYILDIIKPYVIDYCINQLFV